MRDGEQTMHDAEKERLRDAIWKAMVEYIQAVRGEELPTSKDTSVIMATVGSCCARALVFAGASEAVIHGTGAVFSKQLLDSAKEHAEHLIAEAGAMDREAIH